MVKERNVIPHKNEKVTSSGFLIKAKKSERLVAL